MLGTGYHNQSSRPVQLSLGSSDKYIRFSVYLNRYSGLVRKENLRLQTMTPKNAI